VRFFLSFNTKLSLRDKVQIFASLKSHCSSCLRRLLMLQFITDLFLNLKWLGRYLSSKFLNIQMRDANFVINWVFYVHCFLCILECQFSVIVMRIASRIKAAFIYIFKKCPENCNGLELVIFYAPFSFIGRPTIYRAMTLCTVYWSFSQSAEHAAFALCLCSRPIETKNA